MTLLKERILLVFRQCTESLGSKGRWTDGQCSFGFFFFVFLFVMLTSGSSAIAQQEQKSEPKIDFSTQIRPILSNHCFACHGPEEASREGGLRFDTKEGALVEGDSGEHGIVPGKPSESELIKRIFSDDHSEQMPPEEHQKPLSKEQKELLKKWIEQGAEYQDHWAFIAPKKPTVPKIDQNHRWNQNPIDRFVLAKLNERSLAPEQREKSTKLLRRIYLDLIGLPPTSKELKQFVADQSKDKFRKVVDQLLKRPEYGEHQARFWLDAARYGDTHGLHLDNYREMWPYRDWVIKAYNENLPYDQFVTQQLAGDLLPGSTQAQKIATGFVRAHVTTNEGGSILEEVDVRNVVDRTTTVGTVFMGLTMDCSRCHDHKFDPISMEDFYSFYAFFNSIEGNPMDGNRKDHAPILKLPTDQQKAKIADWDKQIKSFRSEMEKIAKQNLPKGPINWDQKTRHAEKQTFVWFDDRLPEGAQPTSDGVTAKEWLYSEPADPVFSGKKSAKKRAKGVRQQYFVNTKEVLAVDAEDELFAHVYLDPKDPPKQIMIQWNDGSWEHRAYWGEAKIPFGKNGTNSQRHMGPLPETGKWVRLAVKAKSVGLGSSRSVHGMAFTQFDGTVYWDSAGVVSQNIQLADSKSNFSFWLAKQRTTPDMGLPAGWKKTLKAAKPGPLDKKLLEKLKLYFAKNVSDTVRDLTKTVSEKLKKIESHRKKLDAQIPLTLICKEMKKSQTSFSFEPRSIRSKRQASGKKGTFFSSGF